MAKTRLHSPVDAMPSTLAAELTRGVVLLIVGLLLPAAVHLVPSSTPLGPVLMPLLIPVALGAFLLPLRSALVVACLMPFLSMSLTAMPPFPIACELAAEGVVMVCVVRAAMGIRAPWSAGYAAGVAASRLAGWSILAMVLGTSLGEASTTIARGLIGLVLVGAILPGLFKLFGRPKT